MYIAPTSGGSALWWIRKSLLRCLRPFFFMAPIPYRQCLKCCHQYIDHSTVPRRTLQPFFASGTFSFQGVRLDRRCIYCGLYGDFRTYSLGMPILRSSRSHHIIPMEGYSCYTHPPTTHILVNFRFCMKVPCSAMFGCLIEVYLDFIASYRILAWHIQSPLLLARMLICVLRIR